MMYESKEVAYNPRMVDTCLMTLYYTWKTSIDSVGETGVCESETAR